MSQTVNFFPAPDDLEAEWAAKAVCLGCPVRIFCLDFGVSNREEGIWGGTNEKERKMIRTLEERYGSRPVL